MKHFILSKKILFGAVAFVFIGAGCFSGNSSDIATVPDEIFKKPESIANPLTEAYAFCEKSGNKIVVQYDAASSDSKVFCVFNNNSQCDAIAFMNSACSKGNGAKIYTEQTLSENQLIRSCGTTDPAVCGVDGKNYTNTCIAALQNIPVLHSGVCTTQETSFQQHQISEIKSGALDPSSQNNTTKTQVDNQTGESANWLQMIIGLSTSQPPRSPRSKISKCTVDKQTYYYFEQGNPEHFSVLYDDNGVTHCFPGNDLTEVCPKNLVINSCKQIWRDAR